MIAEVLITLVGQLQWLYVVFVRYTRDLTHHVESQVASTVSEY